MDSYRLKGALCKVANKEYLGLALIVGQATERVFYYDQRERVKIHFLKTGRVISLPLSELELITA